jgi:thiosulfate/3-mercaptopyruvate sulfurtransferase
MTRSLAVASACLLLAGTSVGAADPRESLVVSTAWLAQHLKDPNLVLLHVMGQMSDPKTFATAHIPGAQPITMADVASPTEPGLEMPEMGALRNTLAALGVSDHSKIVVYSSDHAVTEATRVIYTLDYAGLGANTVFLQGGLGAWTREKRETTTAVLAPKPGTLSPLKAQPRVVDVNFVQTKARTPGFALVDTRARSVYDGVAEGNGNNRNPAGHIPGALSAPASDMFNEREELRPTEELEAAFAKAGVKPGDTVVGYCWVGQIATGTLLAARATGHPVLLYDGSITDWSARKLPLEVTKKGGGSE